MDFNKVGRFAGGETVLLTAVKKKYGIAPELDAIPKRHLLRLRTIQHPLGPELVREHGKTFGPGSFLRGLYGFAFFAESGKQFICLLYRFTLYANKIVVARIECHSRHIV